MPDVIGARQRTPGGIEYVDVRAGTGADALPRQCYFIHYTGWLSNGRQFETTHDPLPDGRPARPIAFAQGTDQVIAGWDRGFGGMRVGGVRRLYVPARLAYGDRGRAPAVPPNAALVFDIALLAVSDTMPAPRPRGAVAPQCPPWETVDPGPA